MVNIDPEFGKWIPPLTSEEYSGLEKSILSEGCRDPLVVWGEIIVDGHNRYKICQKHGIPFNTVGISFATRDDAKIWILENQMARRNLHPIDRIALVKEVEPLIAARAKERHDATLPKPGEQGFREVQKSAPHEKTRDECARLAGVEVEPSAHFPTHSTPAGPRTTPGRGMVSSPIHGEGQ